MLFGSVSCTIRLSLVLWACLLLYEYVPCSMRLYLIYEPVTCSMSIYFCSKSLPLALHTSFSLALLIKVHVNYFINFILISGCWTSSTRVHDTTGIKKNTADDTLLMCSVFLYNFSKDYKISIVVSNVGFLEIWLNKFIISKLSYFLTEDNKLVPVVQILDSQETGVTLNEFSLQSHLK